MLSAHVATAGGIDTLEAPLPPGYPALNAWARRPASLTALDGVPYTPCDSVASLAAASDLVALCLREDSDTFDVAVHGGLLANMRPGSVLVNHGTGLPPAARELTEHACAYGVAVVDAPVSGGHAAAVARQLTTIAGGLREIVDRCTPVFRSFSKNVIYMGATGSGMFGKLFNNTLMLMNRKNIIDILDVAQALELELPALLDVLRSGSASSTALLAFGPAITASNAEHL